MGIVERALASGEGWPAEAVFKVHKRIYDDNGQVAPWYKNREWFFSTKEEMESHWSSLRDGMLMSEGYSAQITVHEWDLGPDLIRDDSFENMRQKDNLAK